MRSLSVLRKAAKILIGAAVFGVLLVVGSVTAQAQPWTAVGATGVVVSGSLSYDCFDQAIGFFHPLLPVVGCHFLRSLPTGSRRVLYNVVAEPNLLLAKPGGPGLASLTVRYLVSDKRNQHIIVRLIQQPRVDTTDTLVSVLLTLNSDNFGSSSSTQTRTVGGPCFGPTLDFDNNAYYITADISNVNTTGGPAGLFQLVVDAGGCIP